MLDRQHLSILREVDRLGSLTAAAERLNVTQSALSHTIRKLEDRYGVAMWEKDGRNLRLTQAGRYIVTVARRVLPQIERAEDVLTDYRQGQRGSLKIGMECHPCHQWLMGVTKPYLIDWPHVDLELTTSFASGGVSALMVHEIDILITPDPIEAPGILYVPVFDYELVLVVPSFHPLANKDHAEPTDLSQETLLTYPVAPQRLDVFTQFLVPAYCSPRHHRTVETTEMMLQLVAAGRGVSAIPDWLVRQEAATLGVRPVRIGRAGIHKSIHLGLRYGEEAVDFIAGFLTASQGS
ncbi:LysR family transcriptional regulator [Sinorhizobium medicae]|uniref:LysR family transcriptional regulator n=1 Tax=Sinorhizobium medicae TaxID=110321 RepID=UPI000FD837B4|nr:LysR family transcriptional regulator [Sinorhizobium medicae]RVP47820.1 LysR family transcriptional regulator [Sinorhizobium medicae]RVP74598.1 LysR family transcriptional regulator [Sinorhizobium medicae]UWU12622.1 LysR family transcriptional regulator [Sinorhizobium medicae]